MGLKPNNSNKSNTSKGVKGSGFRVQGLVFEHRVLRILYSTYLSTSIGL